LIFLPTVNRLTDCSSSVRLQRTTAERRQVGGHIILGTGDWNLQDWKMTDNWGVEIAGLKIDGRSRRVEIAGLQND